MDHDLGQGRGHAFASIGVAHEGAEPGRLDHGDAAEQDHQDDRHAPASSRRSVDLRGDLREHDRQRPTDQRRDGQQCQRGRERRGPGHADDQRRDDRRRARAAPAHRRALGGARMPEQRRGGDEQRRDAEPARVTARVEASEQRPPEPMGEHGSQHRQPEPREPHARARRLGFHVSSHRVVDATQVVGDRERMSARRLG